MTTRKILLTAGAAIAAITIAGCTSSPGADQVSAAASSEATQAGAGINMIIQNQPVPVFATSAYRQELIEVEAVQALGSPTTAFMFPPGWNGDSRPFKVCPAEGLPIPNTAQLDNPDEVIPDPNEGDATQPGSLLIPEMDPNGVYTPSTSSGTYIGCLDSAGQLRVAYWEGDVYAEVGDAVWDNSTDSITDVGPSQLPVCTVETAHHGDGSGISPGTRYYHCVKAAAAASWMVPERRDGKIMLTTLTSDVTVTCHAAGELESCSYRGFTLTFAPETWLLHRQ